MNLRGDLDKLMQDIALIDIQSAAKDIMFSRQRLYEFRDRPGKNLAQILAEHSAKDLIPQMLQDGLYTNTIQGKLQVFSDYYKELYTSESVSREDS